MHKLETNKKNPWEIPDSPRIVKSFLLNSWNSHVRPSVLCPLKKRIFQSCVWSECLVNWCRIAGRHHHLMLLCVDVYAEQCKEEFNLVRLNGDMSKLERNFCNPLKRFIIQLNWTKDYNLKYSILWAEAIRSNPITMNVLSRISICSCTHDILLYSIAKAKISVQNLSKPWNLRVTTMRH